MRLHIVLRYTLVLVAALRIALTAGLATANDKLDSLPYYPLKVGTEWEYVATSPDGKENITVERVVGHETIEGVLCATVEKHVDGRRDGSTHIAVVDDMVVGYGSEGKRWTFPHRMIKTSLNKDDKWKDWFGYIGVFIETDYRVTALDHELMIMGRSVKTVAIAVTATTRAGPVPGDATRRGKTVDECTKYYAKGIGLVRQEFDSRDGKHVVELRSFRAAGEEKKVLSLPHFPLDVGTNWEYARKLDGKESKFLVKVAAHEQVEGVGLCARLEWYKDGELAETMHCFPDRNAVKVVSSGLGAKLIVLFRADAKKGDTWSNWQVIGTWTGPAALELKATVVATDHEVKALGHTRKAVVTQHQSRENGATKNDATKVYYVEGIGLVRMETVKDGVITETLDILSFGVTPPRREERKPLESIQSTAS